MASLGDAVSLCARDGTEFLDIVFHSAMVAIIIIACMLLPEARLPGAAGNNSSRMVRLGEQAWLLHRRPGGNCGSSVEGSGPVSWVGL